MKRLELADFTRGTWQVGAVFSFTVHPGVDGKRWYERRQDSTAYTFVSKGNQNIRRFYVILVEAIRDNQDPKRMKVEVVTDTTRVERFWTTSDKNWIWNSSSGIASQNFSVNNVSYS